MSALTRFATLTLILAALAACEPGAPEEAGREEAAPAAAPMPQAEPAEVAPTPIDQQTVAVRVTADAVEVSPTTVRPGSTTIRITNNASVPYDVDIDGPGPDGEIENLQPGETRSITMMLRVGSYEIESSAEQGPERERETYLTVRD